MKFKSADITGQIPLKRFGIKPYFYAASRSHTHIHLYPKYMYGGDVMGNNSGMGSQTFTATCILHLGRTFSFIQPLAAITVSPFGVIKMEHNLNFARCYYPLITR